MRDGEALTWPRLKDASLGKPLVGKFLHLVPGGGSALAATGKGAPTRSCDLSPGSCPAPIVGRHRMVDQQLFWRCFAMRWFLVSARHVPSSKGFFGETDNHVTEKSWRRGCRIYLAPDRLCGRNAQQARAGRNVAVLNRRLKDGLVSITGEQVGDLVIMVQTVAIGTGRDATSARAQEAHAHVLGSGWPIASAAAGEVPRFDLRWKRQTRQYRRIHSGAAGCRWYTHQRCQHRYCRLQRNRDGKPAGYVVIGT